MKSQNPNCDEIINSFVDGELSPRQRTEIKRLAAHDRDVAGRIRQIKNCRNLLRSLPREDPPLEITENVRVLLERKSLLGERSLSTLAGPKRFTALRWIRAAAAVVLLVAALSMLVYRIVSPLELEKPGLIADQIPENDMSVENKTSTIIGSLAATYELRHAAATDIAGVIEEAAAKCGLDVPPQIDQNRIIYHFSCEKKKLGIILKQLQDVQGAINETQLVLIAEGQERKIRNPASPMLVANVLDQNTVKGSLHLVENYSLDNLDHAPPLDVPSYTSTETDKGQPNQLESLMKGEGQVHLTIKLINDDR